MRFGKGRAMVCQCILPIMLALCLMLLVTYYAFNYAGIIGLGLNLATLSPLPPAHPLICAICDITVTMKKLLKIQ